MRKTFDLHALILKIKKMSVKEWMILCVITGLLIMILFFPTGDKKTENGVKDILSTGNLFGEENTLTDSAVITAEGKTARELYLEQVLSEIEGVGAVSVYINSSVKNAGFGPEEDKPSGILVVCKNGAEGETVLLINEVIEALFSIEPHKIKVVKGVDLDYESQSE